MIGVQSSDKKVYKRALSVLNDYLILIKKINSPDLVRKQNIYNTKVNDNLKQFKAKVSIRHFTEKKNIHFYKYGMHPQNDFKRISFLSFKISKKVPITIIQTKFEFKKNVSRFLFVVSRTDLTYSHQISHIPHKKNKVCVSKSSCRNLTRKKSKHF